MKTFELTTIADAVSFLQNEASSVDDNEPIKLGGELAQFEMIISGDNYHATVPSALARGIWEFQEELYRAVAFSLYGDDRISRLTEEQKAQFELIFEVSESSTDLKADLKEFLFRLGDGMDSKDRRRTIVAIALIIALSLGAKYVADTVAQVHTAEVAAESHVKEKEVDLKAATMAEAARTEQFRLISEITKNSSEAARFAKATEDGTKAIVKGASDADAIRVGAVTFGRAAIDEVNQRAAKEKADAKMVIGSFSVLRAEARDGGITRFWLIDAKGQEFSSIIVEEDFDPKGLNRLWDAVRGRTKISVEMNVTYIRGQVKTASILRVLDSTTNTTVASVGAEARVLAVNVNPGN